MMHCRRLNLSFVDIEAATCQTNAARSKRDCVMARSKRSSPRTRWNWGSISAGWVRRSSSATPLDQFLAHHPEYFFERSPEQALVNPDHLLILLEHLRCAMFELPFQKGEGFGGLSGEMIEEYLQFVISNNEAHESQDKVYWMADQYPAANISLRSASPQGVVLQTTIDDRPLTIGTVDGESALWMVHPGAIYLHEAQSFFVKDLNLEEHIAYLTPVLSDYYTEPLQSTEVTVLSETAQAALLPSPSRSPAGMLRE